MRKDGEWIAMLSGELEVTRLVVRANELLDLVEVLEVDRVTERPARVRFLDPVEGGRLLAQLGAALDGLEMAAIEEKGSEALATVNAEGDHTRTPSTGA